MHTERRNRVRVEYAAQAKICSAAKGTLQGTIRDIGLESVYVYTDPFLDFGEKVEIEIILFGNASKLCITAEGSVTRIDQDGIALRFTNPLEWWPVFTVFPLNQDGGASSAGVNSFRKINRRKTAEPFFRGDFKI